MLALPPRSRRTGNGLGPILRVPVLLLVLLLVLAPTARPAAAEITAEQVRKSIETGVAYLLKQQTKTTGGWAEHPGQPGGLTSLCTLALLHAGLPPEDPAVQRALAYLRSLGNPEMTYATSLQTMVFCLAEPEKDRLLISRNARWLESIQIAAGERKGAWGYSAQEGNGDNSNAQFALLALYEAEQTGVEISDQTWRLALNYWRDCQHPDGSWGYYKGFPASGSMTCAGIASMIIASGQLGGEAARVEDGTVRCCGQQEDDSDIQRGLIWLGKKFSVSSNPSVLAGRDGGASGTWLLYYLYGVERVGRMTGSRFIGRHDWYREGAEMLVSKQDDLTGYWKGVGHGENNPLVATSLALLFLSKGRRPVVISKLKHGDESDWDRHPQGVQHLTRFVETEWRRELSWQTVDVQAATVEDLLETPVLLLSGQQLLNLTRQQRENLREYVNQGGFIFAEACDGRGCNGRLFDQAFRELMRELFPDAPLRLLPPDHPVWYAQRKVDPRFLRPLYGMDACCRTSVVYCPETLSCFWELASTRQLPKYPAEVRDEIQACLNIGANVLAYATNRQLKDKLDRPQAAYSEGVEDRAARGQLYVPKLSHSGGGDDAPQALVNLLNLFRQQSAARVAAQRLLLEPDDPRLFEYPLLFMHGRRDFRFTPSQRKALGEFIERGGFVFADAICASPQFAQAFRREWEAILPGHKLVRIPPDDPLFTRAYRGYDVGQVTLRDPKLRGESDDPLEARLTKTTPWLEAIEYEGRYAVIFSPYDISCALENLASLECKGYVRDDAARLGINILLYALTR
ncbi:MAG: DUF4159 domain-containing protein [Pirellulaceae bacterium]|nr:DUF4159 domain-containing protein [Pirellulaceae bacterium]